jgi:cytochrome c-type biogenesis protein CcmH
MSFIIIGAVMILLATACVAVPLWRRHTRPALSVDAANRAVYAARVEELERDVAAGRLAPEDHAAALRDLDKELETNLHAVQRVREGAVDMRGSHVIAGAAAILLMVAAGLLYWRLGNWRAGIEGVQQASVASVEQMVAQLAHRLQTRDPNDLKGWSMLGHAYLLMGRYADAENAYARARSLSGDKNAEILASYGEAVTLADPHDFMSKAMPVFEQALQLDPRNPRALWYGGLGALERGDKTLAVSRWQALLAQDPPSDYRAIIEKSIVAAGGTLARAPQAAAGTAANIIRVRITLAALRTRVSPDETLFVFAEPAGQDAGPPLVVRRYQVRDLPLDIRLSDVDSMLPGRGLAGVSRATIVARISKSGIPGAQPGDLYGQATWQAGKTDPVRIVINKVVH